jgi:hypothetical protein
VPFLQLSQALFASYNIENVASISITAMAIVCLPAVLAASPPTFYHDVEPILQHRCQSCHRAGEIGPMPLLTFQETRPWAKAIRDSVRQRKMPPWFADEGHLKLLNDRHLSDSEIATLIAWADAGAPAGDVRSASQPKLRNEPKSLDRFDVIFRIPKPFEVPARGEVEYQYFAVATGFREDRWAQAIEVRPGSRGVVHHVVVYIREAGPTWTHGPTKSDILQVYAPGTEMELWPDGMAKLIPAGADLVFEIHYTPNGNRTQDRTQVGIRFAKSPPAKRVLTLQMSNERFVIPPGEPNYRVTAWGSLPNDALLLGFFPHMHLRGKAFEFTRVGENGQPETMLKVSHYDFHWQMEYRLAQPMELKKGTRLEWIAWFDNSRNNPRNPDPSAEVRYGQQSREEMMIGFFDVAVDAKTDKTGFFVR